MERENFVWYRSFTEQGKEMNEKDRLKFYEAICEFALNGVEPELKGAPKIAMIGAKPLIQSNNQKYINGIKGGVHGKKGGRPKKNASGVIEEKPQENPKKTPSVDVNVDEDVDVNDNDNVNVIGLFEDELGRPLSSYEMQMIFELEKVHTSTLLKFALKESVRQGKRTLKYIEGILNNWKSQGVKSVQDAEMVMNEFKNGRKHIVQTWDDFEEKMSEEEREALIREMESWG